MKYIITLVLVLIGFLIIWKSEQVFEMFGTSNWAEEHLHGGTRLFIKLIGLAIILLSFLYVTGIVESILVAVFVR